MKIIAKVIFGICLILGLSTKSFSQTAKQVSNVKNVDYKDWRLTCDSNIKESNFCTIHQSLYKKVSGKKQLVLRLTLNYNPEDNYNFMTISVPIDSWLKPGVKMEIGKDEAGITLHHIPFDNCDEKSCYLEALIADDVLKVMKNSLTGKVIYMDRERKVITRTYSLDDFSGAYEEMLRRVKNK